MNDRDAIVRDLAAVSPIVESDLGDYCWSCGKVASARVRLELPEAHETGCAWRRARDLYPDARSPT